MKTDDLRAGVLYCNRRSDISTPIVLLAAPGDRLPGDPETPTYRLRNNRPYLGTPQWAADPHLRDDDPIWVRAGSGPRVTTVRPNRQLVRIGWPAAELLDPAADPTILLDVTLTDFEAATEVTDPQRGIRYLVVVEPGAIAGPWQLHDNAAIAEHLIGQLARLGIQAQPDRAAVPQNLLLSLDAVAELLQRARDARES